MCRCPREFTPIAWLTKWDLARQTTKTSLTRHFESFRPTEVYINRPYGAPNPSSFASLTFSTLADADAALAATNGYVGVPNQRARAAAHAVPLLCVAGASTELDGRTIHVSKITSHPRGKAGNGGKSLQVTFVAPRVR